MQYHYRWPENCWSLARKATHRVACKLLGTLQLCTALWVLIMSWRLYFLVLRRKPQGQRKPDYILQSPAQNAESTTKLFDCCWILFLFLDVSSNDFYSLEWEERLLSECTFFAVFFSEWIIWLGVVWNLAFSMKISSFYFCVKIMSIYSLTKYLLSSTLHLELCCFLVASRKHKRSSEIYSV